MSWTFSRGVDLRSRILLEVETEKSPVWRSEINESKKGLKWLTREIIYTLKKKEKKKKKRETKKKKKKKKKKKG